MSEQTTPVGWGNYAVRAWRLSSDEYRRSKALPLNLIGACGRLADIVGEYVTEQNTNRVRVIAAIGDVCWYLAQCAYFVGAMDTIQERGQSIGLSDMTVFLSMTVDFAHEFSANFSTSVPRRRYEGAIDQLSSVAAWIGVSVSEILEADIEKREFEADGKEKS